MMDDVEKKAPWWRRALSRLFRVKRLEKRVEKTEEAHSALQAAVCERLAAMESTLAVVGKGLDRLAPDPAERDQIRLGLAYCEYIRGGNKGHPLDFAKWLNGQGGEALYARSSLAELIFEGDDERERGMSDAHRDSWASMIIKAPSKQKEIGQAA